MAKREKKEAKEPIADIIRALAIERGIDEEQVKATVTKMITAAYQKSFGKNYDNCIVDISDDLSEINSLEVIKSQANYFMVKVTGISSRQLTRKLLVENNILIKDLSSKMPKNDNNYVRIAVRRGEENDMLIRAIKEVVKGEG